MGTLPATFGLTRRLAPQLGLAACLVAASSIGTSVAAHADPVVNGSTTVGPAGHAFAASLVPSSLAEFKVGTTTVTCNASGSTGVVPMAPNNRNESGPVASTFNPPTYSHNGGACPTSVPMTKATFMNNTDNGEWMIGMQYDPAGSKVTLTIPRAGSIATIAGLASCTITVAPDAPATVIGKWIPGTANSAPKVDFSEGVQMPIIVTGGFGCPTNFKTTTFKASYLVNNLTAPATPITVNK